MDFAGSFCFRPSVCGWHCIAFAWARAPRALAGNESRSTSPLQRRGCSTASPWKRRWQRLDRAVTVKRGNGLAKV